MSTTEDNQQLRIDGYAAPLDELGRFELGTGKWIPNGAVMHLSRQVDEFREKAQRAERQGIEVAGRFVATLLSERKLRKLASPVLAEVMELAAKNGADSRSMPDEYVALALALSTPTNTDEADKLIKAMEVAKVALEAAVKWVPDDWMAASINDAIATIEQTGVIK